MARSPSRSAMRSRNGWRIPAPAPCASTYSACACSGRASRPDTGPASSPTAIASSADTGMQLLQRVHEVRFQLEDRSERVVLAALYASGRRLDRELLDVELRGHFAPAERHRHRRPRKRPDAERRNEQASVAVLHVVQVHAGPAFAHLPGHRGDVGQLGGDDASQQPAERTGLLVGALPAEWQEDVQSGRAAGLDEARQLEVVAQGLRGARDPDHMIEGRFLGIQVEDAPIRLLERLDPAPPHVQGDRAEIDDVEERLDVLAYEVVDLALRVLAPDALGADPVGEEAR